MNDDFDAPEERRLHSLFGRLREQVIEVSEHFSARLRRRLRATPSRRYRQVEPTRVVGGSLIEIVNVLSRLLRGAPAPDRPPHRHRGLNAPARPEEDDR